MGKKEFAGSNWSIYDIEEEAMRLTEDINTALEECCPRETRRFGRIKPQWWSGTFQTFRKAAQRSLRRAKTTNLEGDWLEHREILKDYRKQIKFSKREAWRAFCDKIKNPKELSKLNKIVQGVESHTIGLLKRPDDSFASTPQESIELLLSNHFPDCAPHDPKRAEKVTNRKTISSDECRSNLFFTVEKVREALAHFGPHKAAGPDGIPPLVLQKLDVTSQRRLADIYTACLLLGYTPQAWRNSKVIFIPKPGKGDYSKVKSFRPISLTSFLFKGMEKVVQWTLEEDTLRKNPLSENQHAFRRGYSTESAIRTQRRS